LKMHLKVHTGEKFHHCTQCLKSFSQSCSLKTHLRRFHSGEKPGKKLYSCFLCTEAFALSGALEEHLRVHFW
jgi:KRAB domain-containing zinc finger protein